MNFDAVADELYSLPREEFTATRDARAREARSQGDTATATRISTLRKPSIAASLANRLSRQHPDEVRGLVELGEALRQAQDALEGSAIRRLSQQRRELTHALLARVESLAQQDGKPTSASVLRELENTFNRVLADPDAARTLTDGRLSSSLSPAENTGELWTTGDLPKPHDTATDAPTRRESGHKRQSLDQRRAEKEARAAEDALAHAHEQLDEAHAVAQAATEAVEQHRKELEQAQEDRTRAEHALREARRAHRTAEERVRKAREAVTRS